MFNTTSGSDFCLGCGQKKQDSLYSGLVRRHSGSLLVSIQPDAEEIIFFNTFVKAVHLQMNDGEGKNILWI